VFSTFFSGLLDLLAPADCPACGLPIDEDGSPPAAAGLCPGCAPLIETPPSERLPPATNAAICLYQGPLADAVRRFKYADERHLLRHLAPLLSAAAPAYAGQIDAVAPVPLHPRKLRDRGWNPAALLARPLAAALGVPLQTSWLTRVRETAVQAGLSRAARMRNVRGAFRAKQVAPVRVLLVDDVRTTGATLLEAASCLEARGHSVSTLALAWSLHDTDDTLPRVDADDSARAPRARAV
jgi:ComF family protein